MSLKVSALQRKRCGGNAKTDRVWQHAATSSRPTTLHSSSLHPYGYGCALMSPRPSSASSVYSYIPANIRIVFMCFTQKHAVRMSIGYGGAISRFKIVRVGVWPMRGEESRRMLDAGSSASAKDPASHWFRYGFRGGNLAARGPGQKTGPAESRIVVSLSTRSSRCGFLFPHGGAAPARTARAVSLRR